MVDFSEDVPDSGGRHGDVGGATVEELAKAIDVVESVVDLWRADVYAATTEGHDAEDGCCHDPRALFLGDLCGSQKGVRPALPPDGSIAQS